MPKMRLGKWSVGLIVVFLLLLGLFRLLIASGQKGGGTLPDNLLLAILFLAGISGIGAFVTGLISILKSKERAVLVFLATIIGLFVPWFIVGEMLVQH